MIPNFCKVCLARLEMSGEICSKDSCIRTMRGRMITLDEMDREPIKDKYFDVERKCDLVRGVSVSRSQLLLVCQDEWSRKHEKEMRDKLIAERNSIYGKGAGAMGRAALEKATLEAALERDDVHAKAVKAVQVNSCMGGCGRTAPMAVSNPPASWKCIACCNGLTPNPPNAGVVCSGGCGKRSKTFTISWQCYDCALASPNNNYRCRCCFYGYEEHHIDAKTRSASCGLFRPADKRDMDICFCGNLRCYHEEFGAAPGMVECQKFKSSLVKFCQ